MYIKNNGKSSESHRVITVQIFIRMQADRCRVLLFRGRLPGGRSGEATTAQICTGARARTRKFQTGQKSTDAVWRRGKCLTTKAVQLQRKHNQRRDADVEQTQCRPPGRRVAAVPQNILRKHIYIYIYYSWRAGPTVARRTIILQQYFIII